MESPTLSPPQIFAEVYQYFKSIVRDNPSTSSESRDQDQYQDQERDALKYQLDPEVLNAILDEDSGLAARWSTGLKEIIASGVSLGGGGVEDDDEENAMILDAVWKQAQTWKLVGGLYR